MVPGPDVRRTCSSSAPAAARTWPSRSTRRRARRRGRDRPRHPAHRRRAAPRPALRRPARDAHRQRRPRLPAHHRQEVRPGRLRAARLADPGQHRPPTSAWSRSCSPEQAFASVRDHLKPTTASSCSTTTTASPGWWPSSRPCSTTRSARHRCCAPTADVKAALADGPGVAASTAALPPGDGVDAMPDVGPAGAHGRPPTTGRSCTCGRASCADYYLVALAIILASAPASRWLGAARVTGTRIRRFSPHFFVLGTPSCCSRRAAWSASACSSARPGSSTRWPSSPSWPASWWPSSSTPASRSADPNVFYVGLFVALGGRLPAAARAAAHRPALAALRARRGARLRARLLRQPRLQPLVPRHDHGRHGLRQQPAGRDGRRRAGVPGAAHRLPGAAARWWPCCTAWPGCSPPACGAWPTATWRPDAASRRRRRRRRRRAARPSRGTGHGGDRLMGFGPRGGGRGAAVRRGRRAGRAGPEGAARRDDPAHRGLLPALPLAGAGRAGRHRRSPACSGVDQPVPAQALIDERHPVGQDLAAAQPVRRR